MDATVDIFLPRPKLIVPRLWLPGEAIEDFFPVLDKDAVDFYKGLLVKPQDLWEDFIRRAGSLANYSSKLVQDLLFGKTAYAGETTMYVGLWTAALDDTFAGNTASEAAYTSYARLALTNNTTIFAAGTGTTTYTKQFPSDAAKSFATSTGGSAPTVTYLGILNGNAGTSADKGVSWCSVTSTIINTGDTPQLAQNALSMQQD